MKCPICKQELKLKQEDEHSIYECEQCKEVFVSLTSIKNSGKDVDILTQLRKDTMEHGLPGNICPSCSKQMKAKPAPGLHLQPMVEYCETCNFIFLKRASYDAIPEREIVDEYDNLTEESVEALKQISKDLDKKIKARGIEDEKMYTPFERIMMYFVPRLIGVPKIKGIPPITAILCGIGLIFSLIPSGLIWKAFENPMLSGRHMMFDFAVSAGFLGVYIAFIFGARLEETIGSKNFLLFIISTYVVSFVLRLLFNPQAAVSGGMHVSIAMAVLFSFLFTFARLRGIFFFRIYTIPVWFFTLIIAIFSVIMQTLMGFSPASLVFFIVVFGMPTLFLFALGGKKKILKDAGLEEFINIGSY